MSASGWGGDPWLPAGPAAQGQWPGADPYGAGYGTGSGAPYGAGYGAGGGYAPPGPPAARPGSAQRRVALGLGLAAVAALLLAAVLFVLGLATLGLAGILLWPLVGVLGVGAVVLGATSVVVAALSPGAGWGSRFAAMIPGVAALLIAVPGFLTGSETTDEAQLARDQLAATLPPDSPPVDVVMEAGSARWMADEHRACLLLARAALGDDCPDDPALAVANEWSGRTELVRADGARALVSWSMPFDRGSVQTLRLVHEDGRWRLLDLPGIRSDCVETAKDPFTCPVRRFGRP